MSELLRAESIVWTCASCGAWYLRGPEFAFADLDKGDCCDKCGSTSFKTRRGRPYGPKSRHWAGVVRWWEELGDTVRDFFPHLMETVKLKEGEDG